MNKLLLIDTFNFLHRAFHALPKTLTSKDGKPSNAVYGVASMVISILDLLKPAHVLAALDGKKPTFRVEEFTQYKAHRAEMDPDLVPQIDKVFSLLDAFGIKKIVQEGYEADDIIATYADHFKNSSQVVIASNDRDMWQLIDENVLIMSPTTKGTADWVGLKEAKAKMGFDPILIPDYKGLRGDLSDNIPGVHGIGEKTAMRLISEFGDLDSVYKNIDKVTPDSLRKKLLESYEIAMQSKKLATVIRDAPIETDLSACLYKGFDKDVLREFFVEMRFKSLLRRLGLEDEVKLSPSNSSDSQLGLF